MIVDQENGCYAKINICSAAARKLKLGMSRKLNYFAEQDVLQ